MIEVGTRVRSFDDIEDEPGVVGTVVNPLTPKEVDTFVGEYVSEPWFWVLTNPREGTTIPFAESELEEL